MESMVQVWPTMRRRVWRVSGDESISEEIEMVLEEPLSLYINGQQVAVLMRLPGLEKELAAGFALSEGLVSGFSSVLTIQHCGSALPGDDGSDAATAVESRNRVEMRVDPRSLNPEARLDVVRLIRAGCGAVYVDRSCLPLQPLENDTHASPGTLLELPKAMHAAQSVHQHAGGVHAAAFFDNRGELIVLCEDVGRHNAVDKGLGHCLLRGIPLQDKLLLCSGRLSYEMVSKAIRMGLPILASVSAPTALAVQLADRFNLTVVGYLRGGHMTIYTHPQRILS
jgi:FdhD protein